MIAVLLALVLMAGRAHAQECRADLNHNGTTDISDLIAAVNEALDGCGRAPTPTAQPGCPYDFLTPSVNTDERCEYVARFSMNCDERIRVYWGQFNTTVRVVLETEPVIVISGQRTGPRRARAANWSDDPFHPSNALTGSIELDAMGRLQIHIAAARGARRLMIAGCEFKDYEGAFSGVIMP